MGVEEFGYTTRFSGPADFAGIVSKVEATLKENGFGVVTEIDVKDTLKEKLNVTVRPYKILRVCNPAIAHQVLEAEPFVGLLLPCNVIVYEEEGGDVVVSAASPKEMFKLVNRPDLADLAEKADALIKAAYRSIAG